MIPPLGARVRWRKDGDEGTVVVRSDTHFCVWWDRLQDGNHVVGPYRDIDLEDFEVFAELAPLRARIAALEAENSEMLIILREVVEEYAAGHPAQMAFDFIRRRHPDSQVECDLPEKK